MQPGCIASFRIVVLSNRYRGRIQGTKCVLFTSDYKSGPPWSHRNCKETVSRVLFYTTLYQIGYPVENSDTPEDGGQFNCDTLRLLQTS